jgi:hypothetical protein
MKPIAKIHLKSLFVSLLALAAIPNAHASKTDSTKLRDVQTSQQMVITEVSHIKGQKTIKYKATLKGVFRVTLVDKDKESVELDWALCPGGGCPVMATSYAGTKEYRQLDDIIAVARKNEAKIKRLAKARPRINETYTERL